MIPKSRTGFRGSQLRQVRQKEAHADSNGITRRAAIAGGAAGVAALRSTERWRVQTRKTFVLIHGAYHGGWCWKKVFTPTLHRRSATARTC